MNAEKLRQIRLMMVALVGILLTSWETYERVKAFKIARKRQEQLYIDALQHTKEIEDYIRRKPNNGIMNYEEYKNAIRKLRYNNLKEFSKKGYKTLTYSKTKWDAVKDRFCLLKNTYEEDGLYYAAFNDSKYYITVGLEEN